MAMVWDKVSYHSPAPAFLSIIHWCSAAIVALISMHVTIRAHVQVRRGTIVPTRTAGWRRRQIDGNLVLDGLKSVTGTHVPCELSFTRKYESPRNCVSDARCSQVRLLTHVNECTTGLAFGAVFSSDSGCCCPDETESGSNHMTSRVSGILPCESQGASMDSAVCGSPG